MKSILYVLLGIFVMPIVFYSWIVWLVVQIIRFNRGKVKEPYTNWVYLQLFELLGIEATEAKQLPKWLYQDIDIKQH